MGMRLPDPFAADAVDSLDFVQPPVSNVDYSAILQSAAPELLMALSSALHEQGSAASVVDHKDRLLTPTRQSGQPEVRYTRRMVTAVVMHIVSFSIQKSIDFEENASGAKTILALLNGSDVEGALHCVAPSNLRSRPLTYYIGIFRTIHPSVFFCGSTAIPEHSQ